jgi:RNA polymerase primary sigma factor
MSKSDGALNNYLREVGRVPLLTPDEEIELGRRIRNGDAAARERMIHSNLRLGVTIARDCVDFGLPLLDLVSEGNVGLMEAVGRFDPGKGSKLSTYASWWIKWAIKRVRQALGPVESEVFAAHDGRLRRLGAANDGNSMYES